MKTELVELNTVAAKKCDWMNVALFPQSMLPPPLVAACRGELVISLKFQLQSAACRTSAMSDAATPRTSVKFNLPAGSAFPAFALVPRRFPRFNAHDALGKI